MLYIISNLHTVEWENFFVLYSVPQEGKMHFFYLKFFSDKIDTIKIENHITNYAPCSNFPIYTYDVFFNNIPICTDCSNGEIYKIEIK